MKLFDTIGDEIKKAMLAHDKIRLEALRSIKKEFLEAKTAKGASGDLSDEQEIAILQKMIKQRRDSATIFKEQNREDLAEKELAELSIIEQYLPEQLSEEDVEKAVRDIIAQTGATSMKEMGKVMGAASKTLAGKASNQLISQIIRKLLS